MLPSRLVPAWQAPLERRVERRLEPSERRHRKGRRRRTTRGAPAPRGSGAMPGPSLPPFPFSCASCAYRSCPLPSLRSLGFTSVSMEPHRAVEGGEDKLTHFRRGACLAFPGWDSGTCSAAPPPRRRASSSRRRTTPMLMRPRRKAAGDATPAPSVCLPVSLCLSGSLSPSRSASPNPSGRAVLARTSLTPFGAFQAGPRRALCSKPGHGGRSQGG